MNKISQEGITLIKQHEGLSLIPYKDAVGKLTIGYGHLIKPGERFTKITEADAEELLKSDLALTEKYINDCVRVLLTQNEFDALVSLAYNIGIGHFERSTFLKLLNKGDRS